MRIKFRLWNNAGRESKMFYDTEQVMECLKQQLLFEDKEHKYSVLGYDHIGKGSAFMQYTGLKDKNGKEIYEGDIVKTDSGANQKVCWREDMAMFVLRFNKGASTDIMKDCEVIGNIYENPDILVNN